MYNYFLLETLSPLYAVTEGLPEEEKLNYGDSPSHNNPHQAYFIGQYNSPIYWNQNSQQVSLTGSA